MLKNIFLAFLGVSLIFAASLAQADIRGNVIVFDDREYNLYIQPAEKFAERIRHYNETLTKERRRRPDVTLRGEITSCLSIIDLPVGVRRGNHSYGGYCTLRTTHGNDQNVVICDDILTGKWNMVAREDDIKAPVTDEQIKDLAFFTKSHCFGG